MNPLTWEQVHSFRMQQHQLLDPTDPEHIFHVVKRIGGIHAQLMSSAELAINARVIDYLPADLEQALWRDRSLIKTWAMRGTLHLLPSGEFPVYVAARQAFPINRPPSYFTYHGVTPDEFEAIQEGIPGTLNDQPMTREELAEALAKSTGNPHLREVLLSGWGALLKPAAFRGEICFGPNQGQNVTFVKPERWIGEWQPLDPQEAIQEMARRYLHAFGPARPEDFARWWGFDAAKGKKVFRALGEEIRSVDVEGWPAFTLVSSLETIQTSQETFAVRLLPQFDAYVVGVSRDCEPVLPGAFKNLVYRPQGWISAVLLVNGRMEGVWEMEKQGSKTVVNVRTFQPINRKVEQGIQKELERLGKYWDSEVSATYALI